MARIICIESSARDDGLTAATAAACLEGAREAGAEVECVRLRELTLEHCRMCDEKGWGRCHKEGRCVIDDDFAELVDKLRAGDGYVFATPVYFSDLSESMKAFTDRLRRCSIFDRENGLLGRKPVVAFACAGGGGGGTTHCMDQFERMLGVCGGFVMDLVPVAQRNKHYKMDVARIVGKALAGELP